MASAKTARIPREIQRNPPKKSPHASLFSSGIITIIGHALGRCFKRFSICFLLRSSWRTMEKKNGGGGGNVSENAEKWGRGDSNPLTLQTGGEPNGIDIHTFCNYISFVGKYLFCGSWYSDLGGNLQGKDFFRCCLNYLHKELVDPVL